MGKQTTASQKKRWFGADVNLIKKWFRLQEECRYAAIHNWRTPTDCLAPSLYNCSKAWKDRNLVVPSKEWHTVSRVWNKTYYELMAKRSFTVSTVGLFPSLTLNKWRSNTPQTHYTVVSQFGHVVLVNLKVYIWSSEGPNHFEWSASEDWCQ